MHSELHRITGFTASGPISHLSNTPATVAGASHASLGFLPVACRLGPPQDVPTGAGASKVIIKRTRQRAVGLGAVLPHLDEPQVADLSLEFLRDWKAPPTRTERRGSMRAEACRTRQRPAPGRDPRGPDLPARPTACCAPTSSACPHRRRPTVLVIACPLRADQASVLATLCGPSGAVMMQP
jgi:hypothetical protein